MYFPRFLVGATTTMLVVAGWVYHATGSIWRTTGWTVLIAIVLQVGYFAAVAGFIYFGAFKGAGTSDTSTSGESGSLPIGRDGISLLIPEAYDLPHGVERDD
ncbi:hypothetical protein [Mesorhizobium sp. 128a]